MPTYRQILPGWNAPRHAAAAPRRLASDKQAISTQAIDIAARLQIYWHFYQRHHHAKFAPNAKRAGVCQSRPFESGESSNAVHRD
jgi:hypothetical protein